MEKREETGTVVKKMGATAFIRMGPAAQKDCEGCGLCALVESGDRIMEVKNERLEPGDRVAVRIRRCSSYVSMLVLLVVPMLLFLVGLAGGSWLWPQADLSPAAMGGAGLLAGLAIAWLVERFVEDRRTVDVRRVGNESARPGGTSAGGAPEPDIARCCDATPGRESSG